MARASEYMEIMERNLALKEAEIAEIDKKKATVQAEIDLLLRMIAEAKGEEDPTKRKRAPRSNVKNMVLRLLQEMGDLGLNAATAVELANKEGLNLERNTVSSLLSRLKADGTVVYDGSLYRLREFASPQDTKPPAPGEWRTGATVHTHPASRNTA